MTNIICLEDKLKASRSKKDTALQQRKILVVQKALQCYHCAFKCEKCGAQVASVGAGHNQNCSGCHTPYRFCDACSEDYRDYVGYLKGDTATERYWQNEAWVEAWRRWIDYQGAVDRYFKSKEFNQLVDEMRQNPSDL